MDELLDLKSAQKIPLFSKITLFDLLQLEENLPPSHSLLYSYLNTLTPLLQSIPATLPSEGVIFKPSFTTILLSNSPIILYTSQADLEALKLNKKLDLKQFHAFQVDSAYALVPLIKLWLRFKSDLLSFIDKLNPSSLSEASVKEIELFIYNKVGLDRIIKLKQKLRQNPRSQFKTFSCHFKPITDISLKQASPIESLSYSESEETEQIEEISFQISDVLKDKFPRFSAASLAFLDTPGKDLKKSYLEYNELLSPQVLPNFTKTPVDSPKQSALTISQVKERLETTLSESPKIKKELVLDFEVIKSLQTELTHCSESKQQIPFESKSRSCECSSCIII